MLDLLGFTGFMKGLLMVVTISRIANICTEYEY